VCSFLAGFFVVLLVFSLALREIILR